ncbi:PhoD-like phosphatase [Symmachiella dynata]|nr:PhoD-like phosphatase [Symmachiella dynata]
MSVRPDVLAQLPQPSYNDHKPLASTTSHSSATMNHSRLIRKYITFIATVITITATATVAFPSDSIPEPITIDRKGGKPTIPEVPRDEAICFALYTVQDNILKLSAQLYPLRDGESREVTLQIHDGTNWKTIARSNVDETGWLATFRIEDWDHSRDHRYRVTHPGGAKFAGRIRKDPRDKDEIVVAAFTGNSNSDRGMREDIVRNVKAQDPDLLFFSGDQSYDHRAHTAAWLLFGRQFGEIIKDRPTITIPDDHDVGQGNLWGEAGKVSKLRGGADGGYIMSPEYVNMVQRAQTSHLPDPYDATPIGQGITVYYTSLNVGGIDFAIIEDRKWKTGPAGLIPQQGPRPDHINNPSYDRASVDVPEARLLGDRQLKFLRQWGQSWGNAEMKAVLSQTIFAGGAHIHGSHNGRLLADLDSNGWPQAGRARALEEMRRSFAFHIAGDQHLATVIHHGINSWEDAGVSFCVPSIVNFYGRWWWPLEKPENHPADNPLPFTGRYYDGLGNKLTMQAYANPKMENHNAAGYGIVRFQKPTRNIVMECWPRHVDVTEPGTKQHPGWPITITQQDNYHRQPLAYLPTLNISGQEDPVVQVVDEALDEVVYTLRIHGTKFRPGVFKEGVYTIRVGEGDQRQELTGVKSVAADDTSTLEIEF